MNQGGYDLAAEDDIHKFRFVSEGPRGRIDKMVVFSPLPEIPGYYNLSFGDWNEITEKLDDTVISNNKDTLKILGTVAKAVEFFLEQNPGAVIFASGGNAARSRLYQINILRYWGHISARFVVRGSRNKKWQPFRKGVNFDAFTLFRKQLCVNQKANQYEK